MSIDRLALAICSAAPVLLFASACSLSCKSGYSPPAIHFHKATIRVKGKPVVVEVANTSDKIARGLMHRRSLPRDEGMLFVYSVEQILAFWMRDTRIALDIAFIESDGRIAQIVAMEPLARKSRLSETRAMFALEMNRGWFASNCVKVGDFVEIPDDVANSAG